MSSSAQPKSVEELCPAGYPGWVYVLRLENSCWYVGYTANLEVRIAQHFLGRGSIWTRRNPPISVESVQPGDTNLENALTVAYMCRYSWRLVRGGKYVVENMKAAPAPILMAFSRSPPKPLPELETEVINGHSVTYYRGSCRAVVVGARGERCIWAETDDELRSAVLKWLDDDD